MQTKLLYFLAAAILLLTPDLMMAQAPTLGACSSFALFTAAGAFSNAGAATDVTGDVGTNVGAFSAFPPGILIGQIHVADPTSAQAAADMGLAYGSVSTVTCGQVISTTMGGGQILLPNVYCLGAASTINGDLTLDGQGDANSLFIFKIDGALATTVGSRVLLTNSASSCNVYWQVNGEVDLGEGSLFQGTILANGAINILEAAALNGRGLSKAGAISLHDNQVNLQLQPVAGVIAASGATTFCTGDSVTLSGNNGGSWNNGSTASSIKVTSSGDFFVTNTTGCGSDTSNHIIVTVTDCSSGCPVPVITSIDSVCGNVASMCWTSVTGAIGYMVRWNIMPDTTWIYTFISGSDTCRQFTNHAGDVNQLQVAVICANGDTSVYSIMVTWNNYLVCPAPTGLVNSNITATSADLSWNATPGANEYKVLYKIAGTSKNVKVTGTTLPLTGLTPSTTVKWKVKSRCASCGNNIWSSYSPFKTFTTSALRQFALEQQPASTLLIFPNPATVTFVVNFNLGYSSQQSYTLAVQDVVGHVMISEKGTLTDGLLSQDVSLNNAMSNGIYFVTVTTDGQQLRERLVVTRE